MPLGIRGERELYCKYCQNKMTGTNGQLVKLQALLLLRSSSNQGTFLLAWFAISEFVTGFPKNNTQNRNVLN